MPEQLNKLIPKISERLKQLRIDRGYTSYRNFADDHEIDAKQYWRIEEGKLDYRMGSLLRILEIHNVTLEEFFKGLDAPKK